MAEEIDKTILKSEAKSTVKNDMYTYHYYRNRSLKSGWKKNDCVVQIALFFFAGYVVFTLLHLIH